MKWFIKCIKNYANFKGRARRSEYWYFLLVVVICSFIFGAVDIATFGAYGQRPCTTIFGLFIFLPHVAVMTRRLHDTGHSGKNILWFYLSSIAICLLAFLFADVPTIIASGFGARFLSNLLMVFTLAGLLAIMVWAVYLIVWFCKAGDEGPNKYGPDPKQWKEE